MNRVMNRVMTAFLGCLGLLVVGLLFPLIWAFTLRSCAAAGVWCWGWVVAVALSGLILTGLAALYLAITAAQPAAGEPEVQRGMAFPDGGTLPILIWLFVIFGLYAYLLLMVLVPESIDENAIFVLQLLDSQVVMESAVAFLAAGIGAIAATVVSYLQHAASCADWQPRYIPWYILRPFLGSILGVIFFWLIRGGMLAILPADNSGDYLELDLNGLAGACALVGMFSRRAMLKLAEVFRVIFNSRADNSGEPGASRQESPPSGSERDSG